MRDYLKRLLTTGAAYQAADIVAKGLAVILLPLYTRHVPEAGYGAYQTLLTCVILSSIVLRFGQLRAGQDALRVQHGYGRGGGVRCVQPADQRQPSVSQRYSGGILECERQCKRKASRAKARWRALGQGGRGTYGRGTCRTWMAGRAARGKP